MPFEVKLPDIGEGVAEGEIVRWMVNVGDAVKEDQPLVEVMTDKASVEIPSPRSGTIAALHAEAGAVLPVGSVLVSIALSGETAGVVVGPAAERISKHSDPTEDSERWNGEGGAVPEVAAEHQPTLHTTAAAPARVQATPAVRQLAKQMSVAL